MDILKNIQIREKDKSNIFYEQQKAFEYLFHTLDLSKVAFVGGVADYINLRSYYKLPVHDFDIIYQNEEDILPLKKDIKLKKYHIGFYKTNDNQEVVVAKIRVNNKEVHMDCFPRNFEHIDLQESMLLGYKVLHASFEEMRTFHNYHIQFLTSTHLGKDYKWERLYKHSKKAGLYNNIVYSKEIGQLEMYGI